MSSRRVSIITGAGSGIGRSSAEAFAEAGYDVVLADIDLSAAEETAALAKKAGVDAMPVRTDVTDADDVEALVAATVERFGRLDAAHNNAGVLGASATLAEYDDAEWHRVVAVNLTAVYLCMKHEIRAMLAAETPGSIVNTASFSGLVAVPFAPAYVATKHGVVGLTRSGAVEYGRKGIRVNAVCPGTVRTDMTVERMQVNPKMEKALSDVSPMKRIAETTEIADAVVWLCSDQASFVNGHALPVDGGATAQ